MIRVHEPKTLFLCIFCTVYSEVLFTFTWVDILVSTFSFLDKGILKLLCPVLWILLLQNTTIVTLPLLQLLHEVLLLLLLVLLLLLLVQIPSCTHYHSAPYVFYFETHQKHLIYLTTTSVFYFERPVLHISRWCFYCEGDEIKAGF